MITVQFIKSLKQGVDLGIKRKAMDYTDHHFTHNLSFSNSVMSEDKEEDIYDQHETKDKIVLSV